MPLDLSLLTRARVNRSAVERRAATLVTRRAVKQEWQAAWLLRAVSVMDLTTLAGDDTPGNVQRLCAKARQHYVAENLAARASEFADRIALQTGWDGSHEVETAISRLFSYAAWADKYDGAVHGVPLRGLTLALVEPIGVMGLVCADEAPLLGFVSLLAPAVAMGNSVVIVPSEHHPLSATDLYQVLETSDLPAGVVNIVTGRRDVLAPVLAAHDDVDAVRYFGSAQGAAEVEKLSSGNMKRTWTAHLERGWFDPVTGDGHEFLREATQVKNIWTPSGE